MKKKNLFYVFLFLFYVSQITFAQGAKSTYLVRSTTGLSGSSQNIIVNNKAYTVQQSIGQMSAIGTFHNSRYTIRQGFIQPLVLAKITDVLNPIDLDVSFYPNPFAESASLVFSEKIFGNVEIAVYNVLGSLVFSKTFKADQKVKLDFNNLSLASYILKVTANNKQFIKNIIKKNFR
jgi:hypothetical protein